MEDIIIKTDGNSVLMYGKETDIVIILDMMKCWDLFQP